MAELLDPFSERSLTEPNHVSDRQEISSHLPDLDRLSVITAILALVYILAQLANYSVKPVEFRLLGWLVPFKINTASWIILLSALLAGLGSDWLIQKHPNLKNQRTVQYWIIPALTAWALGVVLNTLRLSTQWWIIFGLGMVLLLIVYVSEYIIVDLSDLRRIPATMALIAVSYTLLLVLSIAIDAADLRLYLIIPILATANFLVAFHTLYLRTDGVWHWNWSLAISIIVVQLAIGFHYLPLNPLMFGLLLTGFSYGLVAVSGALIEQKRGIPVWLESVIIMGAMIVLSVIFR